jgi:hypothetical protein
VNNIEIMKLILKMYSFEQPVPDAVKIQMMVSMRKNLIIILKRFGKYGILTMAAVYLLFILKKIGLSISLFKAYILLILASAFVAGAIGVVTFTVVRKHFTEAVPLKETAPAYIGHESKKLQSTQTSVSLRQNCKLEILPFAVSGKTTIQSDKVTDSIYKYMKIHLKDTVVLSEINHGFESPYMMVGSIIHLADNNLINARLVDAKNSTVLLYVSEEWNNDDDLGSVAERIAFAFSRKMNELYVCE